MAAAEGQVDTPICLGVPRELLLTSFRDGHTATCPGVLYGTNDPHAVLAVSCETAIAQQSTGSSSSNLNVTPPIGKPNSCVALPHYENERWKTIENTLSPGKIKNLDDFRAAIQKYNWDTKVSMETFREYLNARPNDAQRFFDEVLPKIVALALSLPGQFPKPIPRLSARIRMSVTMSQEQAACLLACGFLCMFRYQTKSQQNDYSRHEEKSRNKWDAESKEGQSLNFASIFQRAKKPQRQKSKVQKLTCFVNYFDRVTSKMPKGVVTYHRRVLGLDEFPDWSKCQDELRRLHVTSGGLIENQGAGMLQVDFANKMIGGDVLGDGCVQEEIRFTVCPEMIVARQLADKLENNECVVMVGCEQFCKYDGYGDDFVFHSNHEDLTPSDNFGRRKTEVVAIDAVHFRDRRVDDQFDEWYIRRELNKAYCGFYANDDGPRCTTGGRSAAARSPIAVATGNWGCGVFGGDVQLKALVQLMAAAANRRDVLYFTFGNRELCQSLSDIHRFIVERGVSVGDLWKLVAGYGRKRLSVTKSSQPWHSGSEKQTAVEDDLFGYIRTECKEIQPTAALSVAQKQSYGKSQSESQKSANPTKSTTCNTM